MNKRCYIAGAGEFYEKELPGQEDYVIAADGGYAALTSRGITPDLVVGDFDSLSPDLFDAVSNHPNVIRSPAEKDETDMMLAVEQGLESGCKTFIINGGLGGRLDQTIANIQILAYIAQKGARGVLLGPDTCVTSVKNGEVRLNPGKTERGTVSVFCAGDKAEGVTLRGLKYPLENAVITSVYPIGVSNEFLGIPATISVKTGTLIVIWDGGLIDIC